jgi:hypothetical protein
LGEDVVEPGDLGLRFETHRHRAVATAPEGRELMDGARAEEEMAVVGEKDESADADIVASHGAGKDTDNASVELPRGTQQHPALDGAAGDLDERAFGRHVAQRAGHDG